MHSDGISSTASSSSSSPIDSSGHADSPTNHGQPVAAECGTIVSIPKSNEENDKEECRSASGGVSIRLADRISLADLDGFKLTGLGPMVINEDGTVGRITNWSTMTPQEQASAQRLITARNRRRVEALNAAADAAEEQSA